ncbi:MAG: D-glycero-beta-D-manno-heptose 1-phosphate adenylyltransferase [Pirellulaceae bacterium]
MTRSDLLGALERLTRPRVLVLGDLILDRYTCGDAQRVSQEAPIVVLRADERKAQLGGAANVCQMLRGLEATVTCAGVVGNDDAGRQMRTLLKEAGVDCSPIVCDNARPTTVKERFVGRAGGRHPNQIVRVDTECCDPLSATVERKLLDLATEQLAAYDALLISDYAKGVCTPKLLRGLIQAARDAKIPVLVDPRRDGGFDRYRGATLIKPNRAETAAAVGQRIDSGDDAREAGRKLCRRLAVEMAVITLDRDGMALVRHDGTSQLVPTTVRSVYDITGAGDMVLATLGACLAGGVAIEDAVRLANVTAGLEVQRPGTAVVTRDEIQAELASTQRLGSRKVVDCQTAARLAEEHRSRGETIVFTNGCFDLLHVGHLQVLAESAAHGDVLVVGVNSDSSVRRLKGSARPIINERDRAALLAALGCVDYVVVYEDDTPHPLLHAIRPDVLVKGGTYALDEVVGHEVVESYGGRVAVTGTIDGISTTRIVESLNREAPQASTPSPIAKPLETEVDDPPENTKPLRRAG